MKKIIYFGILVLLSTNVFAQYPNWGSVINPGGVSIGAPSGLTNFSDAALHIRARNNTSYPSGAGQQLFFAETRSAFGDNIRIFNGSGSNANIFAPILIWSFNFLNLIRKKQNGLINNI